MSFVSMGSRGGWQTHRRNRPSWVLEGRFGGFVSLVSHFLDHFARVRAHMRRRVRGAAAGRLTKPLKLTGSAQRHRGDVSQRVGKEHELGARA